MFYGIQKKKRCGLKIGLFLVSTEILMAADACNNNRSIE